MKSRCQLVAVAALALALAVGCGSGPAFDENATAFLVQPGLDGRLWITDGTAAGTREIALDARAIGSSLQLGGYLYVASENALWKIGGPQEGSRLVRRFPGPWDPGRHGDRYSPRGLVRAAGQLYFLVDEELWRSDGTAGHAELIWEPPSRFAAGTTGLVSTGERVFFFAGTPRSEPVFRGKRALWAHDPATGETRPVEGDYQPSRIDGGGGSRGYGAVPEWSRRVATLGDWVVFPGNVRDRASGYWKRVQALAGSESGVLPLRQLASGGSRPQVSGFESGCDRVYFTAENGKELWATDTFPGGTVLLRDLWERGEGWTFGPLVCAGGRDVFATRSRNRAAGSALWTSDGSAGGTGLVREWGRGGIDELAAVGDRVFFVRRDEEGGAELWASDGTAEGTDEVTGQGALACEPGNLTPLGSRRMVFTCGSGGSPWVTDGTPGGTGALWARE